MERVLLLLGLLYTGLCCGQTTTTGDAAYAINVVVTDSARNPVQLATVSLSEKPGINAQKFTISDSLGICRFPRLREGSYYLSISAAGFKPVAKQVQSHPQSSPVTDTVVLQYREGMMQAISVTAAKRLIEVSDEKIIYHAQNDASLSGLSAADALAKVPFITVSGDGGVMLKGQSSFQIYLNGKPTSMFSSNMAEVLKSFPASLISKIEVINNPSAKYEGEGLTGIINIVTRNKVAGYNGSVSFSYNTIGQVNPNASFNAKWKRFGLSAFGFYARNMGYDVHGFTIYEAYAARAAFARRISADKGQNNGYQWGGNLEMSYEPDSVQSFTFYNVMRNSGGENRRTSNIRVWDKAGMAIGETNLETTQRLDFPGNEWGADYQKKKKENNFSVSINHQENKIDNELFRMGSNAGSRPDYLKTSNVAGNGQTVYQLDKSWKIRSAYKVEAGARLISRKVNTNYASFLQNVYTGSYEPDTTNAGELSYRQEVAGAYGAWNYGKSGFSIQVSSRIEHTKVDAVFANGSKAVQQRYLSWLPALNLSRTFTKGHRLNLSYSKRLTRPGISFLNPVTDKRDPLFLSYGNERLGPEIMNSIQLSLSRFGGRINYSISLNGLYVSNSIQRFIQFDPVSGITRQTYGNVGAVSATGLSSFISFARGDKLSISLNTLINYSVVKNKTNQAERNEGFYGSASLSLRIQPQKSGFVYTNINYTGAPVQLQGRAGNFLYYNVGGGFWLRPEKLLFTAGAVSMFNREWTFKNEFHTQSFSQLNELSRPFRGASFSLRWMFGKLKDNATKKKGVSIDDAKPEVNNQQ